MAEKGICDIVYCFTDTNVLIHYQTFDEVDWPRVLHDTVVYLVLAPAVIAELDRFKDDSSNEWRQTRVRTLQAKLRRLLGGTKPGQQVRVRSGVYVLDIVTEPVSSDWSALGLDPSISDDRLLASIVAFTSEGHEGVVLVSDESIGG